MDWSAIESLRVGVSQTDGTHQNIVVRTVQDKAFGIDPFVIGIA